MKNTRLIKILRTLDPKELEQFEAYLKSPLYKVQAKQLKLFICLKKYHPAYEKLETQDIIQKLATPQDPQLATLRFELKKHLNHFLILLSLAEAPDHQNWLLTRALRKRKLDQDFEKAITKQQKALNQNLCKSDDYYLNKFRLEYEVANYQITQNKGKNLKANLDTAFYYFQYYTFIQKAKILIQKFHYQNIKNPDINFSDLDLLLNSVSQEQLEDQAIVHIYHTLLKMLYDINDKNHFLKLERLLSQHTHQLSKEELITIYRILTNYCTNKINDGQVEFVLKRIEFCEAVIEATKQNQWMPYMDLKIIVTLCLRADKFEEAINYNEKYITRVDPKIRHEIYHCNLAAISLYQRNYDETIKNLIEVRCSYHKFSQNRKFVIGNEIVLLKCYYEKEEGNNFNTFIDNIRKQIRNCKTLQSQEKQSYMSFLSFIRNLYKFKIGVSTKSLPLLINKIQLTQPNIDQEWLLKKAKEIKK